MSDLALLPPVLLLLLGLGLGMLVAGLGALVWKLRYTRHIRRDAVLRSQATISGLVHEQLLPFLPEFPFNPKDARFLGTPVDLVVFDGLDAGQVRGIVFLEVKTGGATLSARERQVRDAIKAGNVSWLEIRSGPGSRAS
jgi:predicted Holliday junction resolvase-like endonuclease